MTEPVPPAVPLWLLPGWGLGHAAWGPALEALPPGVSPRLMHVPDDGATLAGAASFEAHAAVLAAALPTGSVLCGWSLGALMALAVARQAPERLRGLVLVGATPCFMQRPDWLAAQPAPVLAAFASAVREQPAAALSRFAALVHQGDAAARPLTRALQQRVATHPVRPSEARLMQGLRWLCTVDLRPALASVLAPCLLIHGAHDAVVPTEAGDWLARHLPRAGWVTFPRAGHAPFLSDPARFGALVGAFCAALGAGPDEPCSPRHP